jgi:tRNA-uridine 2-sulfurtransferase
MTFQKINSAIEQIHTHIEQGLVVVGMSGGVDSAVSAALLKAKGYDVVGMFMKNWEDDASQECPAEADARDVAQVAKIIGIPFYTVNFTKEYWEGVFEHFLEELKQGLTPNPDILCNREVKFKKLLEKAIGIGGSALATGHYAATRRSSEAYMLERACDQAKDQTYFLYTATQASLSKTIFPLAHLKKTEVRDIAKALSLPVAEKKDSTGICFIGERKFRDFLQPYLGRTPGDMKTLDGNVVGTHCGLPYYTIGQRKGIGIGGQGDAWFVAGKDIANNCLLVVQGANHPALYADTLIAKEIHWISGQQPSLPLRCTAKIRYRQPDQPCVVTHGQNGTLFVSFDSPQRAITPQQAIVFYDGPVCLGGAFIQERGPSYFEKKDIFSNSNGLDEGKISL